MEKVRYTENEKERDRDGVVLRKVYWEVRITHNLGKVDESRMTYNLGWRE